MNNKEDIAKFLSDLNQSDEGKQMLQMVNPVPVIPVTIIPKKEKKKKDKDKWWIKTFNKDKLKKPNKVGVIFLRNNGNVDLLQVETKNGLFSVNGKGYHEDRHCIYTLTKDRVPIMIIREWDLIPLGTKKWEDEDMREKFAELEQHVLKGIRNAELVKMGGGESDSKFTTKQVILWVIVAVVAGAILINYI